MVLLTVDIFRQMFKKPFEEKLILEQMVKIGVESIPVAVTTALFTGMVLALQAGYTLETKIQGVSQFIGSVVSISMVRELGPVLTAMVIAGRRYRFRLPRKSTCHSQIVLPLELLGSDSGEME